MTKCSLENVEYLQDVTEFWTVDKDGEPVSHVGTTEQGDFVEYHCSGCDDFFKTWEQVKEHIA